MLKQLIGTVIIFGVVLAVNASDYFPAKIGNKWEFDYECFTGHSAGGETDSGMVTWTITAAGQKGNAKEVTIKENRNLRRKTYSMYGKGYDSTFNPPRELPSMNLSFIDSGNVLYRTFQLDGIQTTEVLVHDPKSAVPNRICVHDTTISVLRSERAAKLVITGSCDLSDDNLGEEPKHRIFDFFFQCDSIGPVEYHYDSHGTTSMVGGHDWENWTLHSLPLSIKREIANAHKFNMGNNGPQLVLRVNGFTNSKPENKSLFDLNGRILPDVKSSGHVSRCNGVFICLPGKALKK